MGKTVIKSGSGPGTFRKVRFAISSAVTGISLFAMVLLAVPACLLISLIGGIWEIADKLIRILERTNQR